MNRAPAMFSKLCLKNINYFSLQIFPLSVVNNLFTFDRNSLIPAVPVIKCFVIPPNSKLDKTAKKSLALRRLAHKFTAVSRSTT